MDAAEHETIDPAAARERIESGEWTYLDVRTPEEFAEGRVPGAVNVPVARFGPAGMEPDPGFREAVQATFAPDAALVVGCRTGVRSAHACVVLAAAGFTRLADMAGGMEGTPEGPDGAPVPGWNERGFPVER